MKKDIKMVFNMLLEPFEGRRKYARSAYAYPVIFAVGIFAMLGYTEFFAAFFPQFYDKVNISLSESVWTVLWNSIKFVGVLTAIIYSLSLLSESFSRERFKTRGFAIFKFIVFILCLLVVCLIGWSKLMPDGLATGYKNMFSQLSMLVAGIVLFVYISDLKLRKLQELSPKTVLVLCGACLFIQILPYFSGEEIKGATRTICGFQVCDLLAPLIVFGCAWLSCYNFSNMFPAGFFGMKKLLEEFFNKKKWVNPLKGYSEIVLISMFVILFVIYGFQKNFSTAAVYTAILLLVACNCNLFNISGLYNEDLKIDYNGKNNIVSFFISCLNIIIKVWNCVWKFLDKKVFTKKWLLVWFAGAMIVIYLMIYLHIPNLQGKTSSGFRENRVINWMVYDADLGLDIPFNKKYQKGFARHKSDKGGQAFYSKQAIIQGGFNGGSKERNPVLKLLPAIGGSKVNNSGNKIAEAWSDFIFSVMCSEWGFWKIILFLFLPVTLFLGYLRAVLVSDEFKKEREQRGNDDPYLTKLADGILIYFSMMILAHVYVNLSLAPNTGLPLPLFSKGGMSLLINMCMLGVLFNLSKAEEE